MPVYGLVIYGIYFSSAIWGWARLVVAVAVRCPEIDPTRTSPLHLSVNVWRMLSSIDALLVPLQLTIHTVPGEDVLDLTPLVFIAATVGGVAFPTARSG